MKVAILGGGLAGTSCAYMLARAGAEPVIYETGADLAGGASGNALGLYNPRLAAEMSPESEFYSYAFFRALDVFAGAGQAGWNPCGALHLMSDDKKRQRFEKMAQSWNWPEEDMRIVPARTASDVAGVEISMDAVYLPRSGYVSPKKLCAFYAQDVEIRYGAKVQDLSALQADAVILACGPGVKRFAEFLPLQTLRGQITQIRATEKSKKLKTALCYGGYVMPAQDGTHWVGSTFQRWLSHTDILPDDDADNTAKMFAAVPALRGEYDITGQRAALRVASKDQFPVVGKLPGREDVYISAAHGSHGILSSLAAADILTAMILGSKAAVSENVLQRLNPGRFL